MTQEWYNDWKAAHIERAAAYNSLKESGKRLAKADEALSCMQSACDHIRPDGVSAKVPAFLMNVCLLCGWHD